MSMVAAVQMMLQMAMSGTPQWGCEGNGGHSGGRDWGSPNQTAGRTWALLLCLPAVNGALASAG